MASYYNTEIVLYKDVLEYESLQIKLNCYGPMHHIVGTRIDVPGKIVLRQHIRRRRFYGGWKEGHRRQSGVKVLGKRRDNATTRGQVGAKLQTQGGRSSTRHQERG